LRVGALLLQLNVNRTRGRAAKPIAAVETRQLVEADLALLATERGVTSTPIKRLRDSHHALARALAVGCTPAQAQVITGYSNSRISVLQADPAFQELVSHYRGMETDVHADMVERMKTLGLDALGELQERLEEDPSKFSEGLLLDVVKTLADRTGAGPSTKQTNVNVSVDYADMIRAARERSARVIDHSPVLAPPARPGEEEPGS
jgi:hypothetical protein